RERPKCNHISRFEIPGLDDYRVMPIGGTLHDFASLYKYPESAGRIKIDTQIDNVDLQHEIISRGQIIPGNRTEFVLAQFGLEVVEGQDICTVWIAEYNSKPLKDFKEVRCPVLRGPTTTPGTVSMRAGTGFNIDSIFSELSRNQDIIVEDHTGIDKNTRLALEIPNFKTEKGAELAEKWYSEHFGITFRKEQRRMPVWIIRKAQ
ncbi:MAG: hypothetical protein JW715_01820, partial [Sedimentisphaerales bacterium]|nr:hypothetical protein [Sedimentisphaerales bacterium]